jgi:hypothetical protein
VNNERTERITSPFIHLTEATAARREEMAFGADTAIEDAQKNGGGGGRRERRSKRRNRSDLDARLLA